MNAKTVARDLVRQRKRKPRGKNQHSVGLKAAAYATLRKAAREDGVPIGPLASAAVFAGLEEARRIFREEIEATS